MATQKETRFVADMQTALNKDAILKFATGIRIYKSGVKRQSVDIREAFANDTGHELAAALTMEIAQGLITNKDIRSYNAAMGRECVLKCTLLKGETVKRDKWPHLANNKHGVRMDSTTKIVTFGPMEKADNKKEKDPVLVAYGKLKSAKLNTPENAAIICRLIEGMLPKA